MVLKLNYSNFIISASRDIYYLQKDLLMFPLFISLIHIAFSVSFCESKIAYFLYLKVKLLFIFLDFLAPFSN